MGGRYIPENGNTDTGAVVFNPALPVRVFIGICYRGAS